MPLRLTKPLLLASEGSEPGLMAVASEPMVFSVQPAKPAATLEKLGTAPPGLPPDDRLGRPPLLPPPLLARVQMGR